jgi:hypothetical protein
MRKPGRATWLAALLGRSGVLHLVLPRICELLLPPELGTAALLAAVRLPLVPAALRLARRP